MGIAAKPRKAELSKAKLRKATIVSKARLSKAKLSNANISGRQGGMSGVKYTENTEILKIMLLFF